MGGEIERVARLVVCDVLKRPPPEEAAARQPVGLDALRPHLLGGDHRDGLSEVGPVYGVIGWTYFAAASFAIVYLGEHYVADIVVGLRDRRGGAARRAARGAVRAGGGARRGVTERAVCRMRRGPREAFDSTPAGGRAQRRSMSPTR